MQKHIFKTSNICFFIYKKRRSKHVRVLAVCNTQKKHFLYFLSKTHTSHLIIIKVNKPYISQILKALINQLLNPKKYVETCSYIFTGNTTWFYLSLRYLIIYKLKHFFSFLIFFWHLQKTHTHSFFIMFFSCTHIYMLPITKIQHKTTNTLHK
jgi:hypothetical protein